ncbi:MAG: DUF885 domain-containing protein [Gemmataceae bacterium]|nr:DUF885 domain-containing protein [Gemmataceae bacterium]
MHRWLASFLVSFSFISATRADEPNAEDKKLETVFKTYLDEEFKKRPLEATRNGDHRFDHLLDDVSAEARAAGKARTQKMFDELPKLVSYEKLSRSGQIDFEIFRHSLKRDLWLIENTRPYEDDPRVYNDLATESVYLLLSQSTEPKPVNLRNAAERIRQIPKAIEVAKKTLKNPPKVVLETAIKQNKGAIAFYESSIYELAEETPMLSTLKPAADKVVPVLKEYQKFLETEVLPNAKGEWRLGKEKFDQKLQLELDAGVNAAQVLADAEAEMDRVEGEMYVIARQLWHKHFPKQPMPPDDANGKRLVIKKVLDVVSDEHGKPEDLVKDATTMAGKIKNFIREKKILTLPEPDRCRIVEMPEFQRGNSIAYLNPAPPLDPKSASYYAISPPPREWDAKRTKSFMREYNRHMLQILTIHEAYPGHYVQLEYSNRHPSLIRKVLWSGVFAEGWAVYTEGVMADEGFGGDELAFRLNQLKWYLRAVANAILDYRMHCTDMTDEEAMHLLVTRAYQSEGEAVLKVIRAKQSSAQLSTYFVGRMAFQRLRRQMQNELKEKFELGAFHEAVLSHGTLPVKYLPEIVGRQLGVRK